MVGDGTWTPASALGAGSQLQTRNGSIVVSDVALKTGTATVFNIEVEDAHTYFFVRSGILVHNNCRTQALNAIERVLGVKAAHF